MIVPKMEKLVTLIVVILLIIIIVAALSGWRSDKEPVIRRFPTSVNRNKEGENFISQTVPTAIFELYRSAMEAFEHYGLQLGYKFKDGVTAWEFYVSGSKINFDEWMQCYREMFPYGHDFKLPTLKSNQDIYCISMDVTEDTYSHEYVEQLNVYLNVDGKPKYEYTLKPDGVFTFRGEAFYHIKSQGKKHRMEVAKHVAKEGFNAQNAIDIMKWTEEKEWYGLSYGFFTKGRQIGLYIFKPDIHTVKSYLELRHPNMSSAREDMLKTIQEIAVYFEDDISDLSIVRDGFYIAI